MKPIRIIMTECKSSSGGHYVEFKEKDTGLRVGEVDRVEGKYVIFFGIPYLMEEIGRRTKKDSAIKFLQENIRAKFTAPVEFKWNVMRQIDRIQSLA